eukprot:evm.model.scf_469.1 EVM.evm.TU.scf_469.1   scf_469:11926-12231(-)
MDNGKMLEALQVFLSHHLPSAGWSDGEGLDADSDSEEGTSTKVYLPQNGKGEARIKVRILCGVKTHEPGPKKLTSAQQGSLAVWFITKQPNKCFLQKPQQG